MTDRATDRDLIAAYQDGVSELTADERRRVEELVHSDPAIRAEADAAKAMIAELRALPPEGTEPNWTVLEREIRAAVGPTVPRRPFRLWRWLVPVGALAMTAAIAMLVIHHPHDGLQVAAPAVRDDGGLLAAPITAPEAATGLWLDGHVVDVDDLDPAFLDDDDGDALATGGLLPADDLHWIDSLDDSAIDRAETWLDKKKKS